MIFWNEVKGKSAPAMSRDLGVEYQSTFVLCHKIGQALAGALKGRTVLDGHWVPAVFKLRSKGVVMKPSIIPPFLVGFSIVALSTLAIAQQKTVAACEDEWKANKPQIQASGKKKKDFMAECRSGSTATTTAPTTSTQTQPQTPPTTTPPPTKQTPKTGQAQGANQYATDTEAKSHCPGDTVVWVNTKSKVYHFAGAKNYGTTKKGAYMCEKEALGSGNRTSKTEKHP